MNRHTSKKNTLLACIIAAVATASAAQAADLPRLDRAKPLQKDIGRTFDCCGAPKADLRLNPLGRIARGAPNTGFCGNHVGTNYYVVFSVVNMGSAVTPATTAQVDFGNARIVNVPIPPLAPGGASRGYAPIPIQDIFQGDRTSRFQITVDPANAIAETNKGNNRAKAYCKGTL